MNIYCKAYIVTYLRHHDDTFFKYKSMICGTPIYLMTAMLIMGKYFSYLTACAVSRAVMQVEKILSHLPRGKESTFLTPRSVVKVTFLPSDS